MRTSETARSRKKDVERGISRRNLLKAGAVAAGAPTVAPKSVQPADDDARPTNDGKSTFRKAEDE
jgi:hypothetical protein